MKKVVACKAHRMWRRIREIRIKWKLCRSTSKQKAKRAPAKKNLITYFSSSLCASFSHLRAIDSRHAYYKWMNWSFFFLDSSFFFFCFFIYFHIQFRSWFTLYLIYVRHSNGRYFDVYVVFSSSSLTYQYPVSS